MEIGKTIANLRDAKAWSQADLANNSGISRVMIGKYERSEAVPSVEVAAKIARTLEVSLDYLCGETTIVVDDKKMLNRLELLQKLDKIERDTILYVVDSLLQTAQPKLT